MATTIKQERFDKLEAQVRELTQTCAKLNERLGSLERRLPAMIASATELPVPISIAEPIRGEVAASESAAQPVVDQPVVDQAVVDQAAVEPVRVRREQRISALSGRSFIVLGGAFYLRMLTDAGTVSRGLIVGLALCYAAVWFILSDRSAAKGHPLSAIFHSLTATVIAFPLIWEATMTFEVLGPMASAILLLIFTALGLHTAWRRSQSSVAWIVVLASLATGVGLLFFIKQDIEPFAVQILLTAVATVWVALARGWSGLQWPGAVVANLLVVMFCLAALQEQDSWVSSELALTTQALFVFLYLGTFAVAHVGLNRTVRVFGVFQMSAVYLVGFLGALLVGVQLGLDGVFTLVAVALSAGAYAGALVANRRGNDSCYYPYTTLGSLFLVAALCLLPWAWLSALVSAAVAVGLAWIAGNRTGVVFRVHAIVFLISAAVLSGLFQSILDAFLGSPEAAWRSLDVLSVGTVVLAGGVYAILRRARQDDAQGWTSTPPELAALVVVLAGVSSVLIHALGGVADVGTAAADAGIVAVIRTALLALMLVGVAFAGQLPRLAELRVLVRPLLGLTLLKFAIEDLPTGRPGTLFISLLLFGVALIIAARTAPARDHPSDESEEPVDDATSPDEEGDPAGDAEDQSQDGDPGDEPQDAEDGPTSSETEASDDENETPDDEAEADDDEDDVAESEADGEPKGETSK